jgi:hypothetical protein
MNSQRTERETNYENGANKLDYIVEETEQDRSIIEKARSRKESNNFSYDMSLDKSPRRIKKDKIREDLIKAKLNFENSKKSKKKNQIVSLGYIFRN